MKKEIAVKWIDALRSDAYKQGQGRLRDGDEFCCLGVLCDLLHPDDWRLDAVNDVFCMYGIENVLPIEIIHEAEMKSTGGRLAGKDRKELWILNDDDGLNFREIANVIEQHWEEL